MAQNAKIIRNLEEKQTALTNELNIRKNALGMVLLENDAMTLQYNELCTELQQLHTESARLQREIGTTATQMAESDSEVRRLESELKDSGYRLGENLFEQYSPAFESFFGEAYTQATNCRLRIQTLESDLAQLETEMQGAGFFKKMPLQMKKKTVLNTVSSEQTKMKQIIHDRGYVIAQEQLMPAELGGTAYVECCRIHDEIETEQAHRAELTAAKSDLDSQLKANRNRETTVNESCGSLKKQCAEKALTEADSYITQYLDAEGTVLKDFPENQKEKLNSIQESLISIRQNHCQIEIKKLEDAIADCTARIQKMQNEYESNLKSIDELKSKNEVIQENIAGSESLLENYRAQMEDFASTAASFVSAEEAEQPVDSAAPEDETPSAAE